METQYFDLRDTRRPGNETERIIAQAAEILRRGGLREAYSPAELEQLLTFGNAVGALSVQRYGAIPAIPTLAETESFLHAQGLLGA